MKRKPYSWTPGRQTLPLLYAAAASRGWALDELIEGGARLLAIFLLTQAPPVRIKRRGPRKEPVPCSPAEIVSTLARRFAGVKPNSKQPSGPPPCRENPFPSSSGKP